MAVPADLASLTLYDATDNGEGSETANAESLLAVWVPGDDTETGFKIRWSFDNGGNWTDWLTAPAGMTLSTYHSPLQGGTALVEVLPTNDDGDASSSTVSASVTVPYLPVE